jgi:hypothetical protein
MISEVLLRQDRVGQLDRTEQSRTEQDGIEQSRAEEDRIEQNRI